MISCSPEFLAFIRSKATNVTGKNVTHTIMPNNVGLPTCKLQIDDLSSNSFYNLITNELSRGIILSIVERHRDYGLILYDLDIKYSEERHKQLNGSRIYTPEFLRYFISKVYAEISKCIDIQNIPNANHCYVLTKEKATYVPDRNLYKDGLHIYFPYIVTYPDIQYCIRNNIIEETREYFENMNILNDIDDVIDQSIIYNNGIMMYGNSKKDGYPYLIRDDEISGLYLANISMQLVTIYANEDFLKPNGQGFYTTILIRKLSIRESTILDVCKLTDYGNQCIIEQQQMNYKNEVLQLNKNQEMANRRNYSDSIRFTSTENLNYVSGLVDLLSIRRATNYDEWMNIGWTLYNIDYRLLSKWIEFSQRNEVYNATAEMECTILWNKMKYTNKTIGSLIYYVKEDSPQAFAKYHFRDSLERLLKRCIDLCHGTFYLIFDEKTKTFKPMNKIDRKIDNCTDSIVDILYHCYKEEYICSSFEKGIWYRFDGVRWEKTDKGVHLQNIIKEEISLIFQDTSSKYEEYLRNLHKEKDTYRIARILIYKKTCDYIIQQLNIFRCRDSIIKSALQKFYWEFNCVFPNGKKYYAFEELLDNDIYTIGLRNGLYDLRSHEFRKCTPDDYICKSTNNDYIEFSWDSPEIQFLMKILKQIFPQEEVRIFFLCSIAKSCDGDTSKELFYIASGSGGNGKSKLFYLLESAMGDYVHNASISLLTGKRTQSSNATPDLYAMKGKRIVLISEPNQGEQLNVGIMKELTGGEKITCRGLNMGNITYLPQFTFWLQCNEDKPKLPPGDGGTKRRICNINFIARFKENPDPNKKYEFKRDNDLTNKLNNVKQAFFWLLMQYYKIAVHGDPTYIWEEISNHDGSPKIGILPGIPIPQIILENNEKYGKQNDPIKRFLDISVKEYPTRNIYVDDLYLLFNFTKKIQNDTSNPISKTYFVDFLEREGNLGPKTMNGGWSGYTILPITDIPDCETYFDVCKEAFRAEYLNIN